MGCVESTSTARRYSSSVNQERSLRSSQKHKQCPMASTSSLDKLVKPRRSRRRPSAQAGCNPCITVTNSPTWSPCAHEDPKYVGDGNFSAIVPSARRGSLAAQRHKRRSESPLKRVRTNASLATTATATDTTTAMTMTSSAEWTGAPPLLSTTASVLSSLPNRSRCNSEFNPVGAAFADGEGAPLRESDLQYLTAAAAEPAAFAPKLVIPAVIDLSQTLSHASLSAINKPHQHQHQVGSSLTPEPEEKSLLSTAVNGAMEVNPLLAPTAPRHCSSVSPGGAVSPLLPGEEARYYSHLHGSHDGEQRVAVDADGMSCEASVPLIVCLPPNIAPPPLLQEDHHQHCQVLASDLPSWSMPSLPGSPSGTTSLFPSPNMQSGGHANAACRSTSDIIHFNSGSLSLRKDAAARSRSERK